MQRLQRISLCVLVLLAFTAASATAQTQAGEIFGRAADSTGAVLPGVTVTIQGPALITPQTTTTATSGAFRFPNVPVGVYSVTFELAGFRTLVRKDVTIQAGFNAEINARLEVSAVQETVTVSGESPVVDTRSTTIGTNFDKDLLDKIPSARDPWVILEQTPGMVMDRQNVGGNWSGQQSSFLAHGSSSNQMWNMDGATVTDMPSNSSPGYYDFDSFEEIQISTGGNDASQDAGGVTINLVTKSGGNIFKGSGRLFAVDHKFQSNNIDSALEAQGAGAGNPIKNIQEYGFEIGGPIARNRAWFWGGAARQQIRVGVLGFLVDPAGDPRDVNNLNTDLTDLKNYNGKLQYQWTKSLLTTFLASSDEKIRNARGAGPLNPIETTTPQHGPSKVYTLTQRWVATDRLLFDAKVTHSDSSFILDFHAPDLADVQPTFDIVTQMNGRSGSYQNNIRPSDEAKVDGSYFMPHALGGDHSTKFGIRYRHTPYETIDVTGGGATARFRSGSPSEANVTRDGDVHRDMFEWSTYLTDSFRRGRTTINAGARLDYQNDKALAAQIAPNRILPDLLPSVAFTGADSGVTYLNLSPRFGMTYDLRGNQKTVLKANAARYYGVGIFTATSLSPTGQTTLRYPWTDSNLDTFVQRSELDLTRLITFSSNYDPANPQSVTSPRRVDPNLKNDTTDEFVIGVDQELMPNFGLGVNYIWRRYGQFQTSFTTGIGSQDFVPVTYTQACGNASCDQPSYTAVYYELRPGLTQPASSILRNYDQYRGYQGVEVTARKRFADRWLMNGSVTWNDTRIHYAGGANVDYIDPTNVAQQDGKQAGTLNARWVGKLSGMYALPWQMSVAGFFNARDGFPFNRTILTPNRAGALGTSNLFVKDFAAERYPDLYTLDARVDKTVKIQRYRVVASFDVFNLGNASTVLSRITRQNAANANNVQTVISPRVARFGIRMTF